MVLGLYMGKKFKIFVFVFCNVSISVVFNVPIGLVFRHTILKIFVEFYVVENSSYPEQWHYRPYACPVVVSSIPRAVAGMDCLLRQQFFA